MPSQWAALLLRTTTTGNGNNESGGTGPEKGVTSVQRGQRLSPQYNSLSIACQVDSITLILFPATFYIDSSRYLCAS